MALRGFTDSSSGFLDQFLLGVVVSQFCSYLKFIRTDKKLIVAFVVGLDLRSHRTGG
jgi:hypothetical protein